MSRDTITKTVFFAAPREIVWAHLTQKDKLATWFHPAAQDLAPGEEYKLIYHDDTGEQCAITGTVLEMTPPSRLVYTFTVPPLEGRMTKVSWVLEDIGEGTKLTLSHEGVGEAALMMLMSLDAGWDKHLTSLRNIINTA